MAGRRRPLTGSGTSPQTVKRTLYIRLMKQGEKRGGLPESRHQPQDGPPLAARPDRHERRRAGEDLSVDHAVETSDLGPVPLGV
jgi:hypothetical protein